MTMKQVQQSRTDTSLCSLMHLCTTGFGEGLITPHCKKTSFLQNVTHALVMVGFCEHGNKLLGFRKSREFPD